jgi:hypothetical protein
MQAGSAHGRIARLLTPSGLSMRSLMFLPMLQREMVQSRGAVNSWAGKTCAVRELRKDEDVAVAALCGCVSLQCGLLRELLEEGLRLLLRQGPHDGSDDDEQSCWM